MWPGKSHCVNITFPHSVAWKHPDVPWTSDNPRKINVADIKCVFNNKLTALSNVHHSDMPAYSNELTFQYFFLHMKHRMSQTEDTLNNSSIVCSALLNVSESMSMLCRSVHAYSDVGQQSSEDMSHSEADLWHHSSCTAPHPMLRCQQSNGANGQHHSNRLHFTDWKNPYWIPPQLILSPSHTRFIRLSHNCAGNNTMTSWPVQHSSHQSYKWLWCS